VLKLKKREVDFVIRGSVMNRIIKYILYTAFVVTILYFGAIYQLQLIEYQKMYYKVKPLLIFSGVFPIFIGVVLRLPQLLSDIKQNKQWKIDWIKVFVVGLPSLYVSLYPLLFSFGIPLINSYLTEIIFSTHFMLITIAGVIFGYVLFDSLIKK
jgi:hypothetical protein